MFENVFLYRNNIRIHSRYYEQEMEYQKFFIPKYVMRITLAINTNKRLKTTLFTEKGAEIPLDITVTRIYTYTVLN